MFTDTRLIARVLDKLTPAQPVMTEAGWSG